MLLSAEGTNDHGTRKSSPPETEEQRLPGPAWQKTAEELRDGQALGRKRRTQEHVRECGPGLAEVDGQSGQPQHVRRTEAGTLNGKGKWSGWRGAEPASQLQGAGPYLVTQQLAQPGEHGRKERVGTRGHHKAGGPGALPTETTASPGCVQPSHRVWRTRSRPQRTGLFPQQGTLLQQHSAAATSPLGKRRHRPSASTAGTRGLGLRATVLVERGEAPLHEQGCPGLRQTTQQSVPALPVWWHKAGGCH